MTTEAMVKTDESNLPSPVFRGQQMVKALADYRELQKALDESMPDQLIELEGKQFRKKGYWRAISVAFNLTVEPIPDTERRDTNGVFVDGQNNFGYIVMYRATTGMRSVTGDGACFAVEKARRFKCPHPETPDSKRTLHFPHTACPDYDPAFQWRALPPEATEHNIRSHAHTRAMNRAISNLVGFGEVSAEEVERDEHPAATVEKRPARPGGAVYVTKVEEKTGTSKQGKPWTLFTVHFDDGTAAGTFDRGLAERAREAIAAHALMVPAFETKGQNRNLTALTAVVEGEAATGREPGEDEKDPEAPIDAADRKKFWNIAHAHKWTEAQVKALFEARGIDATAEIVNGAFAAMLQTLKEGPPVEKV